MKKVLIVIAVLALIVWVISWFRVPDVVATSAARSWPGGLGRLDALRPLPPQPANATSVKLAALGKALPKNEAVDEFVLSQVGRSELAIGKPPVLPDVAAIRELLLREPVVWARHEEIGHAETQEMRGVQMWMARALVASALAKGFANDAAAWEDLRAVWKLARSLDGHVQMMEQTAALTMARMINAVAWRMPLPAPDWFREVQERDNVQPLLKAYQHQTASYWKSDSAVFPTKSLADSVEHDRQIAEEVFKTTNCDVSARMNQLGTDLATVWRRAFRYRAEREAVANALRAREGKPVEPASRCSDGAWKFDGKTLQFAKPIAMAGPRDMSMSLTLHVKP